jgi:DNA polymerase-3 subunit gamma/tau
MQYRDMHNKRLHVELCLIKLCYLQQALELVADSSGQVVKKTRISGPVAVKTKPVAPVFNKAVTQATEARLEIQTEQPAPTKQVQQVPPAPVSAAPIRPTEAQQTPVNKPMPIAPPQPQETATASGKMSLLDKMRQQKLTEKQGRVVQEARMPVTEEVQTLWEQYTDKMKAAQKHSTVTNMNLATLSTDGNTVVITSETVFGAKVLEQESTDLTEMFRNHFYNPMVHIRVEVSDTGDAKPKEIEPKFLNTAERFKLMVDQYPLIKELKDKLKLDLGY